MEELLNVMHYRIRGRVNSGCTDGSNNGANSCVSCSTLMVCVVAHLPQDDKSSLLKQHRQKELDSRRKTYRQVPSTHAVCCWILYEAAH